MEELFLDFLAEYCKKDIDKTFELFEGYGPMSIPMLQMLIEEYAKKYNMELLDFYDKLKKVASEVISEYGDVKE